jgi:hypothetical protein
MTAKPVVLNDDRNFLACLVIEMFLAAVEGCAIGHCRAESVFSASTTRCFEVV